MIESALRNVRQRPGRPGCAALLLAIAVGVGMGMAIGERVG
jgi:hypothetical protein